MAIIRSGRVHRIVYDQNSLRGPGLGSKRAAQSDSVGVKIIERQRDGNAGAVALAAGDADIPAVFSDDLARTEEAPIARRHPAGCDSKSGVENSLKLAGVDAPAIIFDVNFEFGTVLPGCDFNASISVNRAKSIAQDIAEHHAQLLRTAHDGGKRLEIELDGGFTLQLGINQGSHIF
jgi:hypothetical protein